MKFGLSQIRELAVLISYEQEFNPQLSLESAFNHILQNHKKLGQKVNFEELTEEEGYQRDCRKAVERHRCQNRGQEK